MTQTPTETTETQPRANLTAWHAFVIRDDKPDFLTAPTQRALKKLLTQTSNLTEVLAIVKGRTYLVQVQKTFEFVNANKTKTLN